MPLRGTRRLTVRHSLNLRRLADGLLRLKATLAVDQVRSEDGIDECRFAESRLACIRDVQRELAQRSLWPCEVV